MVRDGRSVGRVPTHDDAVYDIERTATSEGCTTVWKKRGAGEQFGLLQHDNSNLTAECEDIILAQLKVAFDRL